MQHDIFGQQTSLDTSKALSDWNGALLGFLAHSAVTPTHLMAVLDAEPGFALGHAVKGMFYLYYMLDSISFQVEESDVSPIDALR